jgi:hypothetical protein
MCIEFLQCDNYILYRKKDSVHCCVAEKWGQQITGGTHCAIHVLITGNDAITSDNNKNEASGDGISTTY